MAVVIRYDQGPESVIDSVNRELKEKGLELRWDGKEEDGQASYNLVECRQ